jgi:Golgi nucleoside diphosphatase
MRRSILVLLASSAIVLGNENVGFSVVIDAGSSGSRVHVYKLDWSESINSRGGILFPRLKLPEPKLKAKPGLSSFALNPSAAGESLESLVTFAVNQIPSEFVSKTPVYLSATAGLRLLEPDVVQKILDSCFTWLTSNSPFLIRREKISVISGRDEGAFGWLTMNFLQKRLHGMPDESLGTLGTIEMGGASTQVTFLQIEGTQSPLEYTYTLRFGPKTYQLYTHSYLGYGQDQARERYSSQLGKRAEDPCFPVGFSRLEENNDVYFGRSNELVQWQGTGSFSECSAELKSLFAPSSTCPAKPCSFADIHQPQFWDKYAKAVVLVENFFHSSLVGHPICYANSLFF